LKYTNNKSAVTSTHTSIILLPGSYFCNTPIS
jgi:hypothetical protein